MDYLDDEYIDLFADGALITAQKMLQRAHGGRLIEGGLDMPASCCLSKVLPGRSDMHVEMKWGKDRGVDAPEFSDDAELAPADMAIEPGPSDTTPPFSYTEGERSCPGLFGKALRSFGEAIAILNEVSEPTKLLIDDFAEKWGLRPEQTEIVMQSLPKARSTGAAMWGGVGRALRPTVFGYGAAQAGILVKSHGKSRNRYGKSALIDWPRIKAVAAIIGLQVLADDRVAKNMISRLDYDLIQYEIPKAPEKVHIPRKIKFKPDPVQMLQVGIADTAINFMRKSQENAMASVRMERGPTLTLAEDDVILDYAPHIAMMPVINPRMAVRVITSDAKDSYDIVPSRRGEELKATDEKFTNPWRFVEVYTEAAVALHPPSTSRIVDALVKQLGDYQDAHLAAYELSGMIQKVYQKGFFTRLRAHGNTMVSGLGDKWALTICHDCEVQPSFYMTTGTEKMWANLFSYMGFLRLFGRQISRAIYIFDKQHVPVMNTRVMRRIIETKNPAAGLEELFASRKRYWANRYYRNIEGWRMFGKRPVDQQFLEWQMLNACFKIARFIIKAKGMVEIDYQPVIDKLNASAVAYVKKRRPFQARKIELKMKVCNYQQIKMSELDIEVARVTPSDVMPVVTYAHLLNVVETSLLLFVDDIKLYLSLMLQPEQMGEMGLDHELLDDGNEESDDEEEVERPVGLLVRLDVVPEVRLVVLPNQEPVVPPVHVPANRDAAIAAALAEMLREDDDEEPYVAMVNLNLELAEDVPMCLSHTIVDMIREYGESVTYDAYKPILVEAMVVNQEYVRVHLKSLATEEEPVHDLIPSHL